MIKHNNSLLGDSLVLLSGVLLVFSFAPFNIPALALVALILLLFSWEHVSLAKVIWRGYLFGIGQFGVGVYWVYFGVHDWGEANVATSGSFSALFVAYLAIYPALVGWITMGYFRNGKTLRLLLVFPAAWAQMEWLRGWVLTGFPWLQLGYGQIDTPLSGLAPITGVYGVSWLLAFTAGALLAMFYLRGRLRWGLFGLLVSIWWGMQLLKSVEWTQPFGVPFQATLIQGNIPLQTKWLPEQRDATLEIYTAMTREHWDSQLIVWPETALPVIYDSLDPLFIDTFHKEARQHGSDILFGVIASGDRPGQFYNALYIWGETKDTYYKRHLVPFGEYLPVQPAAKYVADLIGFPESSFIPGSERQDPLSAAGYRFAASICYESAFGQEFAQGLAKASYLVNITDDGWWRNSLQPHQHFQMARFRALETGRYMLRSAATGITAFINEKGRVVSSLAMFKRAALTGAVVPMKGSTLYMRWGDALAVSVFILSIMIALLLTSRSRKKKV